METCEGCGSAAAWVADCGGGVTFFCSVCRWKEEFRTDKEWSEELAKTFGTRAGDARYRPEGRGFKGTALRAAYDAHSSAMVAREAMRPLLPCAECYAQGFGTCSAECAQN